MAREADGRGRGRRWLVIAAGIAVSAALLVLTFRKVSFDGLAGALAGVDIRLLGIALAIKGSMFVVFAARTRILIAGLGSYRFGSLVKAHLLAFAVNNVVPLRAGELAKIGYLARAGGAPVASCVALVLTERLIEMFTLCLLLAAALPAAMVDVPKGASFYLILGVSFAMVGVAVAVSRRPELFVALSVRLSRLGGRRVSRWFESRAETFAEGLSGLQRVTSVIGVVLLAALFWGLALINITLVAAAVGISIPWYGPFVVLAFISFGLVVPSTPGNIGTYHYFAAAAMTALGVDPVRATSFALVAHALAVVPYTVIAVPVLWSDYFGLRRTPQPGSDDAVERALGDDLEEAERGGDRVVEIDGDAVAK